MWIHQKPEPVTLLDIGSSGNKITNKNVIRFLSELQKLRPFAHHPSCNYYRNHLIWFGKVPLCMGCTMMSLGVVIGLLLISTFNLSVIPLEYLLIIGILLYIPAIIQTKIQVKSYKLLARTSLGISVIFLVYAGLWLPPLSLLGIVLRFGFIGIFLAVGKLTLRLRAKLALSPCDNCPEGRFPVCSYTNSRMQKLSKLHFQTSGDNDPDMDGIIQAFQSLSNYYTIKLDNSHD
jgi:uncharacterized membrane protein